MIGPVSAYYPAARRPTALSAADQYALAALVASGDDGMTLDQLESVRPSSRGVDNGALRMALTRLRRHLPDGALPEAVDRRYRLAVPTDDVDAWCLARVVSQSRLNVPDEELGRLLRPAEPYDGLASSPFLDASIRQIRHAQRELLQRLARERPDVLRGSLAEHLSAHVELDPCNEQLLALVATTLASAGNRTAALDLIARARREFIEHGLTLSYPLEAIERELLEGDIHISALPIVASARPQSLVAPLVDHLARRYVGQQTLVQELSLLLSPDESRRVAIVKGPSGVGKTRLLAELARRAQYRGMAVIYLAPVAPKDDAAFGPLLAAMPAFRDAARALFDADCDAETRRARLWTAATAAIEREASGRPVLLLVDDCHWLDSYTLGFIPHLSLGAALDLSLVVAGPRDQISDDGWRTLTAALRRVNPVELEVSPLDEEALRELVSDQRPDLNDQQLTGIAHQLVTASGGLPGIAAMLIGAIDEEGLLPPPSPDSYAPGHALEVLVGLLPDPVRRMGVVASVIGPEFDLLSVSHVADMTEDAALVQLDELIRRGLLVERSAVDFTLPHALIQSAFLASELKARLARFHVRAAAWFSDSVHRHARHLAAAVPVVGTDRAVVALVRSATSYLAAGLHREAATSYSQAVRVGGQSLAPADQAAYARALDLLGSTEAAKVARQLAVEAALAMGDHAQALRSAVSGLPEAEPIDGDATIVGNLERLDATELDHSDQFLLAINLARQLAIVGRVDEAAVNASVAADLAVTRDQRAGAAVTRRFVISATSTPAERLAVMAGARAELEHARADRIAEVLTLSAIDHYESGALDAASDDIAHLGELGADAPSLRRWHATLLGAMLATDRGDYGAAHSLRRDAVELAMVSGLREGLNAHLAAVFIDLWLRGSIAEFLPEVSGGVLDPGRSVLARAGAALVLEAAGATDDARSHAIGVARAVLDAPVSQGTAALALVSEVLARASDPGLAEAARLVLAARGDSMMVIGAGAASLGPVARYISALEPGRDRRRELLDSARRVADRSGALLWRVVARRDLYSLAPDPRLADELHELTWGTELVDLWPDSSHASSRT